MIARYTLYRATETFCCDDEHCETYINIREPYVEIIEFTEDNDIITSRKCLDCSISEIDGEVEDMVMFLKRLENV